MTVERWERASEWPLAVGAVVFLAAYAWPVLDQQIPHQWKTACRNLNYIIWAIFAIDYAARLVLAEQRWHYWSRHLLDLVVIAVPILRPLRLLRLLMLLKVLNRRASDSLRGRIALYVGGSTALLIVCASLAVLDAERHARNANITGFGDALWWSATTVTTVGYGDKYPVTTTGRFVAVGLMVGGIALLGVVTASIASWLIDRVRETEAETRAVTQDDFHALRVQIEELKALVIDQQAKVGADELSVAERSVIA